MGTLSPNILICEKCPEIRSESSNIEGYTLFRCFLKKNKKIGIRNKDGTVYALSKISIPEGCKYELEHLVSGEKET